MHEGSVCRFCQERILALQLQICLIFFLTLAGFQILNVHQVVIDRSLCCAKTLCKGKAKFRVDNSG